MKIIYAKRAKEDRAYWEKIDVKMIKRIDQLVLDSQRHPFSGMGKPEPLKFERAGYWSRRINQTHRLIYKVEGRIIYIAQCRYHY